MIILKPMAHETIWGGRRLLPYFAEAKHTYQSQPQLAYSQAFRKSYLRVGHMYSLFDSLGESNIVQNGDFSGKTLHDWFISKREKMGLGKFSHFPLVIAMVDATENLSIQVHPTDDVAQELEGMPYGKNESWYFLEPPTEGFIYCGADLPSVSEIESAIAMGNGEVVARKLEVLTGDYVFVPGGTLHALTAGSLVYEIEENREYTYRLYDYDRWDETGKKRPLHLKKALRSLRPEIKVEPSQYGNEWKRERLYETRLISSLAYYKNQSDVWECITLIDEGKKGYVEGIEVHFGMTLILEPRECISLDVGSAISARVVL